MIARTEGTRIIVQMQSKWIDLAKTGAVELLRTASGVWAARGNVSVPIPLEAPKEKKNKEEKRENEKGKVSEISSRRRWVSFRA